MGTHLPLTESTGHEIIVRTVYQIILSDYKLNPEQYDRPADRLYWLALTWRQSGLDLIADTLTSAAEHICNSYTIASWKTIQLAVGQTGYTALTALGRNRRR